MTESPGKMYAIATSMTVLAFLAIGLRFYAKRIKKAGLSWDDLLIVLATIFAVATSICMFVGTADGQLGRHVEIRKGHPHWTHRIEVFLQVQYATALTQVLTFGFTKLSVLFFYKRIFQGRIFTIAVWTMIGLSCVWTIGFFFSELLQCIPFSVNWSKYGNLPGQCLDVNRMMIAQAWSDIATNIVILLLPLSSIFELQLPLGKKLGVCAIFLLGALTVGSGIAKLVIYYKAFETLNTLNPDITYIETPFIYWPMVESSLGIIGACLPLMRPLVAGAASPGFMRKLRTVHSDTDEGSITLWDQSQMAKSTAGWGSTFSTFQFGSTSTASTKLGSISGPFAQYNGSAATQDRLECVSPKHLDPADAAYAIPKTRPVVRSHPLDNLGVLNDDFPFEDRQKGSDIV